MNFRSRRAELVERAGYRCEYCHMPEFAMPLGLQFEHLIAIQHMGSDENENLAMSCAHCNYQKGTNLASMDPKSRGLVFLFNPRTDVWSEHFRIVEDRIEGISPVGRATVRLLDFNHPAAIGIRNSLRMRKIPVSE